MTQNQLAYHANKERERANRAQEQELHRSNVAKETHNKNVLAENKRQFRRSNWHNAIKNIGGGIGGLAKAINPVASLFGLGGN
jgi:hypothetical protein